MNSIVPRRRRVAHVITRLELGGAQQNTLFSTEHHDRQRFDVHLLAGHGGILDAQARRIRDAQVELLPYLRHPISPLWDPVALIRMRDYFRKHRIDLVHTHSSKAGIVGRLAALLAGVPAIVHTVHGWSFNDTQPPAVRQTYVRLERAAARITDRLVVVAAHNREQGLAHGIGDAAQYQVVHSGIDPDLYRPSGDREQIRQTLGFEPHHRVVGSVACLKPQKAPLDLVRAAAEAHRQDRDLRFFIAGDGPLRPDVEALIDELGLADIVRLLGWRDDVPALLHACDIFLLTSLFEGLPRAVLQAMAAGVPVVATAVDGTPEVVVDEESGLLVPPGRPDLAARAVLRMAADDLLRRRCAVKGQGCLTRRFDIREMVRELDRLYASLLDERPAA